MGVDGEFICKAGDSGEGLVDGSDVTAVEAKELEGLGAGEDAGGIDALCNQPGLRATREIVRRAGTDKACKVSGCPAIGRVGLAERGEVRTTLRVIPVGVVRGGERGLEVEVGRGGERGDGEGWSGGESGEEGEREKGRGGGWGGAWWTGWAAAGGIR